MASTTTETAISGIMTVEVGTITGDVVIATEQDPNGIKVTVAYDGALDVYTVQGSPAPADTAHDEIVQRLVEDTGEPTSLE